MRGEYWCATDECARCAELPPRARRIPVDSAKAGHGGGTTSACAENTSRRKPTRKWQRNYLRVRGEYFTEWPWAKRTRELPPRARRIPPKPSVPVFANGTTSACAENTQQKIPRAPGDWNYLRVRGEYIWPEAKNTLNKELPPRARRILEEFKECLKKQGTTSACAENTGQEDCHGCSRRNYLRVRGEYPK